MHRFLGWVLKPFLALALVLGQHLAQDLSLAPALVLEDLKEAVLAEAAVLAAFSQQVGDSLERLGVQLVQVLK